MPLLAPVTSATVPCNLRVIFASVTMPTLVPRGAPDESDRARKCRVE
jgi:hypothetical protein